MFIPTLGFGLGLVAPIQAEIVTVLLNSAQQIGMALGLTVLAGVSDAAQR